MQGFIVFDYQERYEMARRELAGWLREGKIKRKETVVKGGLNMAEEAMVGLYKGMNTGKLKVPLLLGSWSPPLGCCCCCCYCCCCCCWLFVFLD